MKKAQVGILVSLFLVLVLLMGGILAYSYDEYDSSYEREDKKKYGKTKKVVGTTPVVMSVATAGEGQVQSSGPVLVHDRFVGELSEGGAVVAISNGEAYVVQQGVVLAGDMVIRREGESSAVYRINEPEKSVGDSDFN
jgi:hypothetical protein